MTRIYIWIPGLLLFCLNLYSQKDCARLLDGATERISRDIHFLASDDLKGREPGTPEMDIAAKYIIAEFKESGIPAFTDEGYMQKFKIPRPVNFPPEKNTLVYRNDTFQIPAGYFPLQYSSDGEVMGKTIYVGFGISAPELDFDSYQGINEEKLRDKLFVMDISAPDGIHPHSKYIRYHDLGARVELAKKKGARAVLFVNLQESASDPSMKFTQRLNRGIPVVFIQDRELAEDLRKSREIALSTGLLETEMTAYNIIGFVNNGAERTAVIGAHYDHLGMGGSSSLYRGGKKEIHNGADDNASGTAGMLELARNVAGNPQQFKNYNYLFIAFSGEEMGLLGSSYFTKNSPFETSQMVYMLNMDMIGRLEDDQLAVNGTGTSPVWEKLLKENPCSKLDIKTSASGVGPSDHTSFYYRDIPVLHFFTGTHMDYHKPSDDFEKINVAGEERVLSFILTLMQKLEPMEKIGFTPTTDEESEAVPRFSVTLGVLPDYLYSGTGMKIDGVTEGKPASGAGLKAGDVIIQMGDVKVEDMMSYMKALSRYKAGDVVEVTFQRSGETMEAKVKF